MAKTLQELAQAMVYGLWERRAFSQVGLAKATGRPQSIINRIIHGQQPVTLDIIEAIGHLTGRTPAELLADPSDQVRVLNPLESELLRQLRGWPLVVREALATITRYVANEPPQDHQLRNAVEYLRAMGKGQRDVAVAYLLLLHEGGLSPDVRIGLGLPETDDEQRKRSRSRKTTS